MKLFKWSSGRLPNLTHKWMPIIRSTRLNFDLFIIKFTKGSYIPPHTDPGKKNKKHYRINIVFKNSISGGHCFAKNNDVYIKQKRCYIFRPDIQEHFVTEITEGTRYVLSFGIYIERINERY